MKIWQIKKGQGLTFSKGPFKYYVIKEVGGWWWLNDDVSKKYTKKITLAACTEKKVGIFFKTLFYAVIFFSGK